MEKNPNHPVTQMVRGQWHTLCALALFKAGKKEIRITEDDLVQFHSSGTSNILVDSRPDVIILRLVSNEEAEKIARKEGGLPH
jgi:hypothetical protein